MHKNFTFGYRIRFGLSSSSFKRDHFPIPLPFGQSVKKPYLSLKDKLQYRKERCKTKPCILIMTFTLTNTDLTPEVNTFNTY